MGCCASKENLPVIPLHMAVYIPSLDLTGNIGGIRRFTSIFGISLYIGEKGNRGQEASRRGCGCRCEADTRRGREKIRSGCVYSHKTKGGADETEAPTTTERRCGTAEEAPNQEANRALAREGVAEATARFEATKNLSGKSSKAAE